MLAACGDRQTGTTSGPPPTVSVAGALVKNVRPMGDFNGRIEATGSVEVRPRVSGYIDSVNYVETQ